MADGGREGNPKGPWWNHDGDPQEIRIDQWMRLQNVSCDEMGSHDHRMSNPSEPEGRHHHHDFKCLFQAGRNSMAPLVESQRRQIADVNDAMDQIHRIARRLGTDKAREICSDSRRW